MDILVAPKDTKKLQEVKLPRPKDGELQMFLYDEENLILHEMTRYYDKFRSWFLDNTFCRDGHLNLLTRVDPLFIFIPQLKALAGKQFKTLDDVCSTFSSLNTNSDRLDYALSPNIKWENICDTKEIDNELFIRYSENRTLDWLVVKHTRTMNALAKELNENASKATLISYASDLIELYLEPELGKKFRETVLSRLKI